MRYENGDKYNGGFYNNMKNGEGVYYYKNGNIYAGEFLNNVRTGNGCFTYKKGKYTYFKGQYLNNLKHGPGMLGFTNGDNVSGIWSSDKLKGGCIVYLKEYKRSFEANIVNGRITFVK